MSDRERWIVYPLLFFALLLGARDRIAPPNPLECGQLECHSLVLKSTDNRELITLGPTSDGAVLRFYSSADELAKNTSDAIDFKPAPLRQMLEIGADATGGYTTLFGPKTAPVLKLGHHEALESTGLIATNYDGEPRTLEDDSESSDVVWGQLLEWTENEVELNTEEKVEVEAPKNGASGEN